MSSRACPRGLPPILLALAIGTGLGVAGPGCLDPRGDTADRSDLGRCATCHGDPLRRGNVLRRAAPPRDLVGGADPSYPGVGAHSLHLDGSSSHAAIACTECHRVPEIVHSKGHIDDPRPADLTFGPLARAGGRSPTYDPGTRHCADTWCHRDSDAVWSAPRDTDDACGSCHGLPPPAPHPASERCSVCHGKVVANDRSISRPALHVDGQVEVDYPVESCTLCHGTGQDPAPPVDTRGGTSRGLPGVGAHEVHLQGGAWGRPLRCAECHVVPAKVDAPGHVDALPAEVSLTGVATSGGRTAAAWDSAAHRCADTWCHGPGPGRSDGSPEWTAESPLACNGCHGVPPPLPHPASDRCSTCHGQVIDASGAFVDRALHVDGKVDVNYPGESCTLCHGSGTDPAPPVDTRGESATTAAGVGAHQTHLHGGTSGRPVACEECHAVPTRIDAPGHVDALPAEVSLTGVAREGEHVGAAWDEATRRCADTWCHGPGAGTSSRSSVWTDSSPLPCTACHGMPPPAPHPQMSRCSQCHSDAGPDDVTIVDGSRHVDGHLDVGFAGTCNTCHGGENAAPPLDLEGNTSPSAPGVGAHQTHLRGTPRSRAVPCGECHAAPRAVLEPGHVDTPRPAEVILLGAAAAWGGAPAYAGGSCRDTSCHGAVFPEGHESGGTNTFPVWTQVDGTQAACGSCHGLPPPRPHPYGNLNPVCSKCHENIADDNVTFLNPDLHVDGKVTFTVP